MSEFQSQTKIYREQGGDKQIAEQDAEFQFYNDTFTAEEIAGALTVAYRNTQYATLTNLSTGSTVLSDLGGSSPPVLYSEYGTILLSCTGTMTNGSARIPSATPGKMLHIRFTFAGTGSTGSVIVYASGHASGISGARIIASTGSDLSSFLLNQSAASMGYITLRGVGPGVWAITESKQVTEQPA